MATVTRCRTDLVTVFTKEPGRAAILTGLASDPRGTGTPPGHMVTSTTILTGTVLTASTAIEPLQVINTCSLLNYLKFPFNSEKQYELFSWGLQNNWLMFFSHEHKDYRTCQWHLWHFFKNVF